MQDPLPNLHGFTPAEVYFAECLQALYGWQRLFDSGVWQTDTQAHRQMVSSRLKYQDAEMQCLLALHSPADDLPD